MVNEIREIVEFVKFTRYKLNCYRNDYVYE